LAKQKPKEQRLKDTKVKENVQVKPSKQTKASQLVQENKFVVYGLLGAFMVLVFMASSYKISGDDDLFWHLATGRYIIENKVVPDKDVFGHITSGSEWIPFEWGWDILTYGLYNIGGYNAILIFRSLAFCFVFFVFFMLFRKFNVNSFVSVLLLLVLLVAIMDRLSPRPHIITYIFFSLLLYILLNYKYINREKYPKRLYLIPVIFLMWTNSHMGVLAGGLILFVFTITETIIFSKQKTFTTGEIKSLTQQELKKLWIISIASALVLLINPHGMATFIYAYGHTKMKMLETVNEWQNPFNSKIDFGFIITLYKLFLYSGVVVLFYAYKKKDLLFALMFIAFTIYSVRAIRFTVDYEMIMIPFIVISLNYLIMSIKTPGVINFFRGNIPKAALGLFIVYIISQIPSNSIYQSLQYYRIYGWGINDEFIPVKLFDFIKENKISGTPYNHFGTGGYMVWNFPGERNFIDSRNLNDEIFNEYNSIMQMAPGFEKKLEERGVDYVVYLDPDLIRRPNDLKRLVTNYFSRNPNWKLVFWDDKSMLFLKNVPKFAGVISKYEYRVMNPYTALFFKPEFDNNIKLDPARTKEEIDRKIQAEPNGFLFKSLNDAASGILKGL
jgi:hypothetical protein